MAGYGDLGEAALKVLASQGDDVSRAVMRIFGDSGDDVARAVASGADDVAGAAARQNIVKRALGRITGGGKGPTTAGVKVPKPDWTIRRPFSNLPRIIKYGAPGAGAIYIANALLNKDTPERDWSKYKIPQTSGISPASLDAFSKEQQDIIRKNYSTPLPAYPGAEMYDPMSYLNTQLAQASSGAMTDLANQYGSAAANIKQGGVTGAASINDIYGSGATTMEQIAAQPTSGYDSMIPVSGEMAVAPDQQRAAGASLANYLGQNQLISAQQQGSMAELAQMLGPAYANQYSVMDAQMRAQAEANKARVMSDREYQRQQTMNEALTQSLLDAATRKMTLAETAQTNLINPEQLDKWAYEWDSEFNDNKRKYYTAQTGVRNGEEYALWKLQEQQRQQLGQ
jgi:hypothetical protein